MTIINCWNLKSMALFDNCSRFWCFAFVFIVPLIWSFHTRFWVSSRVFVLKRTPPKFHRTVDFCFPLLNFARITCTFFVSIEHFSFLYVFFNLRSVEIRTRPFFVPMIKLLQFGAIQSLKRHSTTFYGYLYIVFKRTKSETQCEQHMHIRHFLFNLLLPWSQTTKRHVRQCWCFCADTQVDRSSKFGSCFFRV